MGLTRGNIYDLLVILLLAKVSSGEPNYPYGPYNEPGRPPFRGNMYPNEPVLGNVVPQWNNGYTVPPQHLFGNRPPAVPVAVPENTFNPTNVRPAPGFNTFDNTGPYNCSAPIEIVSYEHSIHEPPREEHSPKSRIEIPEATRSILLKALIASLSNMKNKNCTNPVTDCGKSSVYIEEVVVPCGSPDPVTVSGPVSFIPITPNYSPCPEEEYFSEPYTIPHENTPLTFTPEVSTQEVVPYVAFETLPSGTPGGYVGEEIEIYSPHADTSNGFYTLPPGSSADITTVGVSSTPVYFQEPYNFYNTPSNYNSGISIADSTTSTSSGGILYGPYFHPGGPFSDHTHNHSSTGCNSSPHTLPVQSVSYGHPHISRCMSVSPNETLSGNASLPYFLNGSLPQTPITIMEIVSCTAHVVSYGTAVTIGPPGFCVSINPHVQNENTTIYQNSTTCTNPKTANIPETYTYIPETYTYIPETYNNIPETDSYFYDTPPNPENRPCPSSYYN